MILVRQRVIDAYDSSSEGNEQGYQVVQVAVLLVNCGNCSSSRVNLQYELVHFK